MKMLRDAYYANGGSARNTPQCDFNDGAGGLPDGTKETVCYITE